MSISRKAGPSRRRVAWCAVAVLVAGWAADAAPAHSAAQAKEVLVLYSTRRDARLSVVGDRELPRILEQGLSQDLDFYSEYLDLARSNRAEYLRGFRDFLRVKYRGIRFDLVIALQDSALEFVEKYRDEIFPDAPVVFLSSRPATRVIDLRNGTGIVAPPALGGTLDLAAALQPDAREVFVITGASSIDKEYEQQARGEFRRFESRFRITYLSGLPMADLQARLAGLPRRSFVYFVMLYRDGASVNFHPLESLDAVVRTANAPVYSWVDSAMDHGIIGGYLKDQVRQTEAVGKLALRVLKGERPEQIAVETPPLHANQVDWRQLRRWNISETRVPAGTAIRFRTPTRWELFRPYFLGTLAVVLAQTVLIAGLLVQLAR